MKNKRVKPLTAAVLLGLSTLAQGGVSSFPSAPGFDEPVYSQGELDTAVSNGRATGRQEAAAECIGDPSTCGCADALNPCGITLTQALTGAEFGETEPNDHIFAADPLITDHIYWGQSRDLIDEDWYYVTTLEPNQLLTLAFTVPDRVLADSTRLSQGWLVSVMDAAGNVYSQFDTRFALDDITTTGKNESKEISYPTFLGRTGTYYVRVKPQIDTAAQVDLTSLSILYWPYNLAANLSFSGLDDAPPDVNFHDVEVEPNNTSDTANPLSSGVTMYGFLHQNATDAATGEIAGDEDWFRYTSPGNEQVNLAWCGREACAETAIWTIEVYAPDGSQLLATTTDKAQNLHFALGAAGDYRLRVRYQVSTTAACKTRSETEIVCKSDEVPACFKDTNNQYSNSVCTMPSNSQDTELSPDGTPNNFNGAAVAPNWVQQSTNAFCIAPHFEPDTGCNQDGVFPATNDPQDPLVGDPLFRSYQYQQLCTAGFEFQCTEYETALDPNALNVQYNFTFWGTKLVPLTNR